MSLSAHFWTVWSLVHNRIRAPSPPAEDSWSVDFDDPDVGSVRLTGRLASGQAYDARRSQLVVLVHGLGGSIDSAYMAHAARAAETLGLASLRLNMRGADGRAQDFYHAGLSSDLAEVLASPALARFDDVYLLGFSLGGHLCLHFATEVEDPRVRAVAAVCSPLDLELSVRNFDTNPACWAYRRYILAALVDAISHLEASDALPTPLADLRRIRSLREWDRHTVVPRFGFDSPEDYYRRAGVAHRLGRLRRPALLVAVEGDPLVASIAVTSALTEAPESLQVCWPRSGGHVGFPAHLDLGFAGPRGIHGQALGWLLARAESGPQQTFAGNSRPYPVT